jgi:hypothetical protein
MLRKNTQYLKSMKLQYRAGPAWCGFSVCGWTLLCYVREPRVAAGRTVSVLQCLPILGHTRPPAGDAKSPPLQWLLRSYRKNHLPVTISKKRCSSLSLLQSENEIAKILNYIICKLASKRGRKNSIQSYLNSYCKTVFAVFRRTRKIVRTDYQLCHRLCVCPSVGMK